MSILLSLSPFVSFLFCPSHRRRLASAGLGPEAGAIQGDAAPGAALHLGRVSTGAVRRRPCVPEISGVLRAALSASDFGSAADRRQNIDHVVSGRLSVRDVTVAFDFLELVEKTLRNQ